VDEWPISEVDREIPQHKSLAERCAACQALLADFDVNEGITWYADTMDNAFNHAYASWPFRFWVLSPGRVELKPMPHDLQRTDYRAWYEIRDLDAWLAAYQQSEGEPTPRASRPNL
jgi:hypothetical protein